MTQDRTDTLVAPAASLDERRIDPNAPAVIETKSLRKQYSADVEAVVGLDLRVNRGEIFAFLGPNGAGKTTTVRMLTTLLKPSSGEARVAGFDLYTQQTRIRQAIGVALQEAGLDATATGRELLELQGQLFGMPGKVSKARAQELLEMVGLTDAADRYVKTYSGGMKRRLDLASSLVHAPSLIFLDEPTEGLDPASRAGVWQEVVRLNRELDVTVFLTTHYLEEADRLADRLAIIDRGVVVAEGTPASLKATIAGDVVTVAVSADRTDEAVTCLESLDSVTEVRKIPGQLTLFVNKDESIIARVIRALDNARIPVGSISMQQPTLDEVFLRATGSRLEGAHTEGESS